MMKKVFTLLICASLFISCKNDSKTEASTIEESESKSYDQNDGLVTLKGDFIYDQGQNAAVIQTANNTIYGVVVDDNMKALNEKVKAFKKEDTDMIPVTVRVRRFESNKENTWKFHVEIKDIIKVEAPNQEQNDVIKIEN
jgi:hypothetical protein